MQTLEMLKGIGLAIAGAAAFVLVLIIIVSLSNAYPDYETADGCTAKFSLREREIYKSLSWHSRRRLASIMSKDHVDDASKCWAGAYYLNQLAEVPQDRRDEAMAGFLDEENNSESESRLEASGEPRFSHKISPTPDGDLDSGGSPESDSTSDDSASNNSNEDTADSSDDSP